MADYNLVSGTPEQKQMLLAEFLRSNARNADPRLAEANAQAHRFDPMAAVLQMANNPGAANAAGAMAKSAASAGKPMQLGSQGFALPQTGEFISSPMFTEERDEARAATRENQVARLDQQKELAKERYALQQSMTTMLEQGRNDRAADQRALRMSLGAVAAGSRADREADKAEERKRAAAEKAEALLDKETRINVQKLSAFADKKQLPRLMQSGRQLLTAINAAGDKEVPGLSTTEQVLARVPFGDRKLSKEALDNMGAFQGIMNALTRADAGLSQTQGEVLRQQLETFNKPSTSAKTRATILKTHILPMLETSRTAVLGSANEDARKAYKQFQTETGGDPSWMDPLDINTVSAKPGRIRYDAQGNEVTAK